MTRRHKSMVFCSIFGVAWGLTLGNGAPFAAALFVILALPEEAR